MRGMDLKEVWRYPIKSLAGEQLHETYLTDGGVEGDRRVVIVDHAQLRGRCVMTTWDLDTQVQDSNVLRRIVKELHGILSLDCLVE